jgi:photosystem II stability/assembly factor-like uncharacterized protein
MKKLLLLSLSIVTLCVIIYSLTIRSEKQINKVERKSYKIVENEEEETPEARARFVEERFLYEYYRQVNPITGDIPKAQKELELDRSIKAKLKINSNSRTIETSYVNRGPSNLGGRTRALVIDRSDNTGNTIIAGGVSSGVFKTTNGGANWTKVSSNNEIHNVTTIVQDPRTGFENIWYYGTGESIGNSASLSGSTYYGQGIWKSTDGGDTWTQMPLTSSNQTSYDSDFDFIFKLAVHPTTGELFAAVAGRLKRFNGTIWLNEIENSSISSSKHTDVVITTGGRVYAGFSGTNDTDIEGVWTSVNGVGGYTRISEGIFTPAGRVVLALAPSNQDKLYVLFNNGNVADCNDPIPAIEADLWMWNQSNSTFTDFSDKLPDETGCSDGNDPFAIQGGYDLVVSVKPDNENFVVIGGTNAYKKTNITTSGTFTRIGGYANASGYALYSNHHPDIHALVFNPFSPTVLFTGTDGGVHKTNNVTTGVVSWTSLNNNYQTFQFYHVGMDPQSGSNIVLGGAQDNGTTVGGTDSGFPGVIDLTTHYSYVGGDGVSVGISRDDACLPFFIGYQSGFIYRDCPTGEEITPDGSDSQFVTLFHLDQDNNNALYYAGKGELYRTIDATAVTTLNWDNLGTLPGFGIGDNDEWIQTFSTSWGAYNPASSYLLMGGDKGHIYRLDDPQSVADVSTAIEITPTDASKGTFPSIVTGLAIHPNDNNFVLATYSNYGTNSIFLTTNATDANPTWTLVERNLSAHSIRSAAIVEANGQTSYFVGTARGLYSSPDPRTTDWAREAPSEIGYAVVSDLKYRPSDNKLLIGTHGNGMFEATISATPLGIDDLNNISSMIKLYPNPVQNNLNVRLPQTNGAEISYSIYNLSGQIISNDKLDKESIDVSQLSPGMYILQLKTNDGKKGTKSFIKK